MKKVLLFVLATVFHCASVMAQQTSPASDFVKEKMVFNYGMSVSTHSDTYLSSSVELGYRFVPRLYAYGHYEDVWALTDKNMATYHKAHLLGGGLGYSILQGKELLQSIDLSAQVTQGIGKNVLSCTAYDAKLLFRLGGKYLVPTIGIGFRHLHSHTAGVGHANYAYLSVGIGL